MTVPIKKLYMVFLGLLFFAFSVTAFFISFSNRIEGDAAFHALVSREISEKGKIINTTSYILANEKKNFPIAYPEVFHLTGAIFYLFVGQSAFLFLPVIYGILSLFFLFVVLISLRKNLLAATVGVIILSLNVYFLDYSSKYFMEIELVFSILAALTYAIKYSSSKKVNNLYISSLFFGISVAIKQQGLIALPILVVILLFSYFWHKSLKQILFSVIIFTVIAAPPMIQLFLSTGSILYAGDNPPKIVELIEKPIRTIFGIKLLEGDPSWSTLNEGRRGEEITTWRDITNSTSAWIAQDTSASIPWAQLTGVLLILLLVQVIKTKNMKDFIMFMFLSLFYFLLYYLARPRYALPLIVLPSVIVFYLIHTLSLLKIEKRITLAIIFLFTVYTIINFSNQLPSIMFRDDYGFYGVYNSNRDTQLQALYSSIKLNKSTFTTVMSPLPYETAYYTEYPTVWANPYGGTDLFISLLNSKEDVGLLMLKKYHVKYIVIYSDRFLKFTNWAGINPTNGLFGKIASSKNFQLVKSNESGKVYVAKF